MRLHFAHAVPRYAVVVMLAMSTRRAFAQGCEPIRFLVPITLGGEGQSYQPGHEWRVTLSYRRLVSDEWFIGTQRSDALAPGGSSPVFRIHTGLVDVAYAVNDRMRVRLSVPYSHGTFSRTWADGKPHTQAASGIGDVSLQGEAWLLAPRTHARGNIAIGLGVKAPTGSHTKSSQFYLGSGPVDFPADQTIQPGDGGWAILTQAQAFRQVTEGTSLYAFGSYMVSPKARTSIRGAPAPAPNSSLYWSVPDVYSLRSGAAFEVPGDLGVTASLGLRLDGIPLRDLVGGGDEATIKRTSRITFVEPGVSYARSRGTFTVSVPWRMHVNRTKSLAEQLPGALPNAGGFARFLVFASYSHRL